MVKGVHKKIIEVRNPGSEYFEKAVFYLKPGVSHLPPQIAEAAAQMLLEELEQPPAYRCVWKKAAVLAGAGLLITAVCVCAVLLR
ncbi:MAG: hypothetical protein IJ496_06470 [Ruminococcus sp.]|nr:hypothetical protein [Ruminococcus sp.]